MQLKNELVSMRPIKLFSVLMGILWVLFLDVLLLNLYPVGSFFFLNSSWIGTASPVFGAIKGGIIVAFAAAAIWLFVNINYSHKDRRWFRFLFGSYEWRPIMKAQEMLALIKGYEELRCLFLLKGAGKE